MARAKRMLKGTKATKEWGERTRFTREKRVVKPATMISRLPRSFLTAQPMTAWNAPESVRMYTPPPMKR